MAGTSGENANFTMATIHRLKSFNQSTVLKKYIENNMLPVSLYYSVLRNLRNVVHKDIPFKCESSFTKDMESIAMRTTQELVSSLQRNWEELTKMQKLSMQNKWEKLDKDQKSINDTLERDFKKERARKLSKVVRLGIPTKATLNTREASKYCSPTCSTSTNKRCSAGEELQTPMRGRRNTKNSNPRTNTTLKRTHLSGAKIGRLGYTNTVKTINTLETKGTGSKETQNTKVREEPPITKKLKTTHTEVRGCSNNNQEKLYPNCEKGENVEDWPSGSQYMSDLELLFWDEGQQQCIEIDQTNQSETTNTVTKYNDTEAISKHDKKTVLEQNVQTGGLNIHSSETGLTQSAGEGIHTCEVDSKTPNQDQTEDKTNKVLGKLLQLIQESKDDKDA